jgi:HD superfamily phosphodiesterase
MEYIKFTKNTRIKSRNRIFINKYNPYKDLQKFYSSKVLEEIKLRTYFQLKFMKEIIKLKQTFIRMVDKIIIDLPAVERHL